MDSKAFEAFQAWQETMAKRAKAAKSHNIDVSKLKLDPSKMSVELGPPLTEEQFKEYCKKTGIKPQILKK